MHFSLVYVSEKPSHWAQQACRFYSRRLPGAYHFEQTRIAPVRRAKSMPLASARDQEWRLIEAKIPRQALLVLLDERGRHYTSENFSRQIDRWQLNAQDVVFVIAGADGVNPDRRRRADLLLALSQFTLPHEMARLFLIEQLYRSWSILAGHPYHRT